MTTMWDPRIRKVILEDRRPDDQMSSRRQLVDNGHKRHESSHHGETSKRDANRNCNINLSRTSFTGKFFLSSPC